MSRVDPFDIVGRVGFGISFFLGFLQNFPEASTFVRHFGKDVIRSPIQDSEDRVNAIGDKPFLDRTESEGSPLPRKLRS